MRPPDPPVLAPFIPAAKKANKYSLPLILLAPVALPIVVVAGLAAGAATEHIGEKQKAGYEARIAPLLDLQRQATELLEQSLKEGCESAFGLYRR